MIVGLDVGGTNIDTVILDESKVMKVEKTEVDKDNLIDSVMFALKKTLGGVSGEKIERIVLSTTLTTNTVIQGKHEPVGVMIEAGPGRRVKIDDKKAYPFYLDGYIDHRGREKYSLEQSQIEAGVKFFRKNGLKYGSIISKFSVRNPEHEKIVEKKLGQQMNFVTTGHKVSGELNFPRRINTAFLNSSVYKVNKYFVDIVADGLDKMGINSPIYLLKADGGNKMLYSALDLPVETILSGPAASVMGGRALAESSSNTDQIILDIGGTTTDISFSAEGIPVYERKGVEINGIKTLVKGLYSRSLGIGGDTRLKVEKGGLSFDSVSVKPAALGGNNLTPTDAMVYLGLLEIGDLSSAKRVLEKISHPLNKSIEDIADLILKKMVKKIKKNVEKYLKNLNSRPVYTIDEFLYGKKLFPDEVIVLGGPAGALKGYLEKSFGLECRLPDYYKVANSMGSALSRVTSELTLAADTATGQMTIGETGETERITGDFSIEKAEDIIFEKLLKRVEQAGFTGNKADLYLVEKEEFNLVRRFKRSGKLIRLKAAVKPGIKEGFLNGKSN